MNWKYNSNKLNGDKIIWMQKAKSLKWGDCLENKPWADVHTNTFKDTGHYWSFSQTSLHSSQHMHKITNLWTFELNSSSKLRDNNERKITPSLLEVVCFQMLLTLRPQILNQIRGKLLLSRKLHYFRGNRFSQLFILSSSPHYSLQRKVLCY